MGNADEFWAYAVSLASPSINLSKLKVSHSNKIHVYPWTEPNIYNLVVFEKTLSICSRKILGRFLIMLTLLAIYELHSRLAYRTYTEFIWRCIIYVQLTFTVDVHMNISSTNADIFVLFILSDSFVNSQEWTISRAVQDLKLVRSMLMFDYWKSDEEVISFCIWWKKLV